jgi:hypothetical protein
LFHRKIFQAMHKASTLTSQLAFTKTLLKTTTKRSKLVRAPTLALGPTTMKAWKCLSTRRVIVINLEYYVPTITCKPLKSHIFSLTGKPRIDRTVEPSIGGIDQLFWKDSIDDRKNADIPAQNDFHVSSDALCIKILK